MQKKNVEMGPGVFLRVPYTARLRTPPPKNGLSKAIPQKNFVLYAETQT